MFIKTNPNVKSKINRKRGQSNNPLFTNGQGYGDPTACIVANEDEKLAKQEAKLEAAQQRNRQAWLAIARDMEKRKRANAAQANATN